MQRLLRSWCADIPVPGQDDDLFAYLPAERITRHIDGLGRVTAYHWDARFNIVATITTEGTPEAVREETTFEAKDPAARALDALSQGTRLKYERHNLVTASRTLADHHDSAGRLFSRINEHRAQITFRYDLRDQLTNKIGFDAVGRPTSTTPRVNSRTRSNQEAAAPVPGWCALQ